MHVDLNGSLIPADEARISPFDAGFLYGDGLFDTLRSYRSFLYSFEEHFSRMHREAELLQIPMESSMDDWMERIDALLKINELSDRDARVRIQLSRGGGPLTDQVSAQTENIDPVSFIIAQPVGIEVVEWQHKGIRLMTVQSSFARGNFPQIKSLIGITAVLRLIDAFRSLEVMYIMTEGGPGMSTELLSLHIYKVAFISQRLGLASAIAVVLLALIFALTMIFMTSMRTTQEVR